MSNCLSVHLSVQSGSVFQKKVANGLINMQKEKLRPLFKIELDLTPINNLHVGAILYIFSQWWLAYICVNNGSTRINLCC